MINFELNNNGTAYNTTNLQANALYYLNEISY
jgi:hypothetical protein